MAGGEVEVVIVGGGAAGIAAARRLREAGVEALLVEARSRLGGRAWSLEAAGFPIDLGCGWLHSAERNPWTPIAEAQGRAIDKTPPPWMRPSAQIGLPAGEGAAFGEAMWDFHSRVDAYPEGEPDRPAATLLDAAATPGTISSTPSAPITAARSSNSSRCAISRATTTTA